MVFCGCVTTTTQDINVTDNNPFKRFMVIGHEAFFVVCDMLNDKTACAYKRDSLRSCLMVSKYARIRVT